MPNIGRSLPLYWSRSKAIKPQQIVLQAEFIGGKNEACHNRSHTTANPKQLTLQQQWPDAADVRAGTSRAESPRYSFLNLLAQLSNYNGCFKYERRFQIVLPIFLTSHVVVGSRLHTATGN
jgi:hypothetical protein